MTCKASLIISVYKDTQALKAVLDSLMLQSESDFEVIISEDGCDNAMAAFISTYRFSNDCQHLTQEDLGWRKNRALNNAIRAAKTGWLIFIDGDCVLHPRFIEHHLKLRGENKILAGKRVKLNAALSDSLVKSPEMLPYMQRKLLSLFLRAKKEKIGFYEEGIFIDPNGIFGFIPRLRSMSQLKGCNMSFSRKAAEAINGFDEDYVRPAIGEDIDLTWRFRGLGYRICSLRNMAVQYHLWHRENWTSQEENQKMMESRQAARQYVCRNGLRKDEM